MQPEEGASAEGDQRGIVRGATLGKHDQGLSFALARELLTIDDFLHQLLLLFVGPCTVDKERIEHKVADLPDDGPLFDAGLRREGGELEEGHDADVDPGLVIRHHRARVVIPWLPFGPQVLLVVNIGSLDGQQVYARCNKYGKA